MVKYVLALVLLTAASTPALAQTPASAGRLSRDTIAAAARQNTIRVETRRNDAVLNGALIGAGIAIAGGLVQCRAMEPWDICNDAGPILRIGALGAAIGAGVDALIRKREVTYVPTGTATLSVTPVVNRGARGVQLAVRF